ncbi:hypothetical protein HMPREF0454_03963 [Hafnia alvei ATCC 51873]|uniref:Uncharacterized protein n=1 Tax=Hafnia alvei ATCC 51873 TaxID=1002364 RepID=G9YBI2_HAFAL|nr:hypothetical protein HMPREF0454_03963 [Hafnia alvei ATCC 51873]
MRIFAILLRTFVSNSPFIFINGFCFINYIFYEWLYLSCESHRRNIGKA